MKIIKITLLFLTVTEAFAATINKNDGIQKLASTFAVQPVTFNAESAANLIELPDGLDITIDNKWQFNFKSKQPINIYRISIAIDDTAMANQVNLEVNPKANSHYYFSDAKLQDIAQLYTHGYKFLGVYKQITANDFPIFTVYRYKKLRVTITWGDINKNYNQSVTNFMLVMAK